MWQQTCLHTLQCGSTFIIQHVWIVKGSTILMHIYLAKSLPAVISWLNEAFLMLLVSSGSKTESTMNTI